MEWNFFELIVQINLITFHIKTNDLNFLIWFYIGCLMQSTVLYVLNAEKLDQNKLLCACFILIFLN